MLVSNKIQACCMMSRYHSGGKRWLVVTQYKQLDEVAASHRREFLPHPHK